MRRHRLALATVLALAVSLFPISVAEAQPAEEEPQADEQSPQPDPSIEPDTRIVGGTPTNIGDFPFQAAVFHGSAFRCGGTVIAKSWVLTAGHCLYVNGRRISNRDVRVMTGSSFLRSGGQRLRVRSSHVHPSYANDPNFGDDVALLRLQRPTHSPAVPLIGSSPAELALDDADETATILGWGTTYNGGNAVNRLRRASVPITSDAVCAAAYPPGGPVGNVFAADTMLCAGLPTGGVDSCQGDSGGPLLTVAPDGWRQVGVTSWGRGCAAPDSPGVYSRLTNSRSWLESTPRFGPFAPDGLLFINQQMLDFYGRPATNADFANWYALFKTQEPSSLLLRRANGSVWDRHAGSIARLNKVVRGTYPSTDVYNSWVKLRRGGMSLAAVAPWFSPAQAHLDDGDYVDTIYENAMGSTPSTSARTIWMARLQNGSWTRADMLLYFSESGVARARLHDGVRVSSTWYGMLRVGPSDATIADHTGLTDVELVDLLLDSYSYAYRFG